MTFSLTETVLIVAVIMLLGEAIVSHRHQRRAARVARLHVVLQFELSSGQWDDAAADLVELERLSGSWPEFSAMVRATIQAGLEQRRPPPETARPAFDEESQSYVRPAG